MEKKYISLTTENIDQEHLCCAISDKKHQHGVSEKKAWLKKRLAEGHVFRKLDEKGKVFIEYAPLEKAWVPIDGEDYIYIYCLWVSGAFKGKGHGKALLEYCIRDAKKQGKAGVCILSSKKKKPFLSEKRFLEAFGFKVADTYEDEYELMALSFEGGLPYFSASVKAGKIDKEELTIYYSPQCPYIQNCIEEVERFCTLNQVPLALVLVDSLDKAKSLPCIFNNWAVFNRGSFETVHILNEGYLKKLLFCDK